MTFSVIIPTYNRELIIGETIVSVLRQTFTDFEIIVVDDGSTDNTAGKVRAMNDPRIRYFYKKNEERSVARNYGAAKANGRYLIFLDSDDRMRTDHLARLDDYLRKTAPGALFLFSGYRMYDRRGVVLYSFSPTGIFKKEKLIYGNHLGCSAVTVEAGLFRKHRFHEHPDIILFEDWELWLRILSETSLHCVPGATIEMFNHGGRSVLSAPAEQLIRKASYFLELAAPAIPLVARSPRAKRRLAMGLYSYAALHTALSGAHKKTAFRLLVRATMSDITLLGKRRFYATLRHLLL